MVFCGKPSRHCERCRLRRMRCDQRRPACTQCINASSVCPGYRNIVDLLFHDETKKVRQRALKTSRLLSRSSQSSGRYSSSLGTLVKTLQLHRDTVLDLPIESYAQSFFLSSYIMGGNFEYLAQLCERVVVRDPLLTSLEAVALASLSQERRSRGLMTAARTKYIRALQETNHAVQSRQEAVKDGTLISVLLLSLFENITQEEPFSCDSWLKHMKGAVALLQLRQPEQFRSALGGELYKQVGKNIHVGCVQQRIRIPPEFLELHKSVACFIDISNYVLQFSTAIEGLTNLQAAIRYGELTDPEEINCLAKDLDDSVVLFASSVPPEWCYSSICTQDRCLPKDGGKRHINQTHRIIELWNTIRMTRLMLNEIIYKYACMGAPCATHELLCSTARETIEMMASEICATVPQFRQSLPAQIQSPRIVASGHILIWPLSILGASELVPVALRLYAIESLHFIGADMLIPQAAEK
ncbi:hypothetical protein BGW36DRAFT_378795 [Talaromyces proteolyticus]|uniref:Zn(2)-C6 fungal-type domain-containing protein n=1 Tax=Talaromyces proteolyticus TaxID=1131652 RepID=A0AAD4Q0B9_9EURO|nr:uncharacterized protein BGW36DRAFT_378795 [Talaromyces proteolyticus]KAH8697487.1 hypothetical protein BGW36DRAFT_378795 [Talaromyces proteolyticus]